MLNHRLGPEEAKNHHLKLELAREASVQELGCTICFRHSTAISAVLADTSETLSCSHARAPHAAASTEEESAIAVRATETRQLCDVGSLWLGHAGALRKPFERAP